MPFNSSTAKAAGQSRSTKKAQSARQNGKQGGRPASRTLAERLLGQKLWSEQKRALDEKFGGSGLLTQAEKRRIEEFFGCSFGSSEAFDTTTWRRKSGRMPADVRSFVEVFRIRARYILAQVARTTPKDYYLAPRNPDPGSESAWKAVHPNMPFPQPNVKHEYRKLPNFNLNILQFRRNPQMTAADIKEQWGSAYAICADSLVEYLRWLVQQPDSKQMASPEISQRPRTPRKPKSEEPQKLEEEQPYERRPPSQATLDALAERVKRMKPDRPLTQEEIEKLATDHVIKEATRYRPR
jgi:hypothetical protein